MVVFVVYDIGFELFDVLDAALLLGAALGLERGAVARFVEQLVIQLGEREEFALPPQVFHHLAELLHRGRAARERGELRGGAHHVVQQHAVFGRKLRGVFDRLVADLARGHIDDAPEAQLVRRVFQHPQIGEHVADLGTGEEVAALVHAVGDAGADERGGDVVREHVVAVQHREIAPPAALLHPHADGVCDVGGLALLTIRAVQADLGAIAVVGPQLLALAADVVADDLVGGV